MTNGGSVVVGVPRQGGLLYNFVETGHILRDIYREESPKALFKGLGPTLVGVVPARSINFYTYGNGKHIIANHFNDGKENSDEPNMGRQDPSPAVFEQIREYLRPEDAR
ncbi:hypothetical protein C0995_004183 [Termitomyces sp. Mi166|nr:hypothetical protein C0995_004183 [Termitomyces sp. Mi166\